MKEQAPKPQFPEKMTNEEIRDLLLLMIDIILKEEEKKED